MKITMYELLGMVKDGKAPKNARIRYFDRNNDYYDECNLKENEIINRLHYRDIELNDEVEILEEEKKENKPLEEDKKIPEKLNIDKEHNRLFKKDGSYWSIKAHQVYVYEVLNEIIDYLKSKGE